MYDMNNRSLLYSESITETNHRAIGEGGGDRVYRIILPAPCVSVGADTTGIVDLMPSICLAGVGLYMHCRAYVTRGSLISRGTLISSETFQTLQTTTHV